MKSVIAVMSLALLLVACAAPASNTTNNTSTDIPANSTPTNNNFDAMPPGEHLVQEEMVTYFEDVQGFMARPDEGTGYPGVILIHEWWGLNDNIRETARRIASHGYVVLAVDLYDGKVATTSEEAQQYRTEADPARMTANLAAANEWLKDYGSEKTATWGFCFGGGESMRFALQDETDATVVYYGNLQPAIMQPDKVKDPVLLIYGDQDTSTTAQSAQELKTKLEPFNIEAELHIYPGVGHAFANPSNPGHNSIHTEAAWEKTLVFLDTNLH